MPRNNSIYAVYKGEENICDGTLQEIAERLHTKIRTVQFYASPTYKKRIKSDGLCVIKIQ